MAWMALAAFSQSDPAADATTAPYFTRPSLTLGSGPFNRGEAGENEKLMMNPIAKRLTKMAANPFTFVAVLETGMVGPVSCFSTARVAPSGPVDVASLDAGGSMVGSSTDSDMKM